MVHSLPSRAIPVLIFVGMLLGCNSHHGVQNSQRFAAKTDWQPIKLPARPVYITSNADVFWVSGTDEMLAKSDDGGRSWRLMHQRTGGDVLMVVHFLGKTIGYAAGTNGLILWTKDGGETWKSQSAGSETTLDISFGDEKHGIRHTHSALEITRDGGLTWVPVPSLKSTEERERFKTDFGLAALDSKHSAALLKDNLHGDQIFLITSDGGKTWNTHHIPSAGINSLVVYDREYWAFGFEVIEKEKPGGGYSVPVALHSADGASWVHGAQAPYGYSDCNAQGCILWDGAIVELYNKKARFTAVPADGSLTPMWAGAKGSVCSLGPGLKCAKGQPVDVPPPRPQLTHSALHSTTAENLPVECLFCPLDSLFVSRDDLGGHTITTYSNYLDDGTHDESTAVQLAGFQSSLHVSFVVRKNGTVDDVLVMRAPTKEIESAVSNYIGDWLLDPPRENGMPTEARHNILLGISCLANPSDQEAACLLQINESDSSFLTGGSETK